MALERSSALVSRENNSGVSAAIARHHPADPSLEAKTGPHPGAVRHSRKPFISQTRDVSSTPTTTNDHEPIVNVPAAELYCTGYDVMLLVRWPPIHAPVALKSAPWFGH